MPVDLELWNKLNDFQFDDPRAAFRFTDRVARENGWTKPFARSAVNEYKKFVYLAATSETAVTPCDVVDQVWHLHLTFTRSYWDEMCANLLGRPLHHGPTKGGAKEDAKYRIQYEQTLTLYREEFGAEPPAEFWPPPGVRFANAAHQRWVDARTHFIVPKPKLAALWAGAALATTGATAAIAADGATGSDNTAAYVIGGVAATALLLFGALFSGTAKRSSKRRGKGDKGGDDGSSSFIASTGGAGGNGKGKGEGGEGGEGGSGDGGSGCGGGGGCGSS